MQSRCLQTLYMPEDHTTDNLSSTLRTLSMLGPTKQVCITTDNGSNIVCATTRRLHWTHLPCFGHNLNLAEEKSIKDDMQVSRALGVCRKTVVGFSHSWKRKRELIAAQERLELPKHSMVTDCVTRWGSIQKMVGRILEQEHALRQVLSGERTTAHLVPTWQDIEVLGSLQAALGPLADFTDMLSGEERVTLSAVKPVLHILKTEVLAESSEDTRLTADIKGRVLSYMEHKYADSEIDEMMCRFFPGPTV